MAPPATHSRAPAADQPTRVGSTSAASPIALAHRNDLQGLRAVAVLLVVLSHAGVTWLAGGYVGVDVFFVLSGFLITGLLLKEARHEGSVSITEFYKRRVRRILPAAALTLVVTDVAAYELLNFVRAKQVIWDSIWSTFFAANIHFAKVGTDYFARSQPPSPLQHFWTLSVEEQFYVVWPGLLALVAFGLAMFRRRGLFFRRHRLRQAALIRLLAAATLIAVASLGYSIHERGSAGSYFSTFARAWELALGALLAIAVAATNRTGPTVVRILFGWAGLAMIIAAGVLYSSSTPFPGYAALLPTVGTALVIAAGVGGATRFGAGRLLSILPMRYIGDRSYTLYLWHWPVLILAFEYERHELSLTTNLALLLGAFALSIVTYAVYENPLRRTEWSGQATASAATVAVAASVFIGAFLLTQIDDEVSAREAGRNVLEAPLFDQEAQELADMRLVVQIAKRETAFTPPTLGPVAAAARAADRGAAIPSHLTPPVSELLNAEYHYPAGCVASDGQSSSRICRLASTAGPRTMVVMGDSHAQMWMPAILATAEEEKLTVVPITKSACGPSQWLSPDAKSDCRSWFRWAVRKARAQHPEFTIIGGVYALAAGAPQRLTVSAVAALAAALRNSTKHIVFIGDPPPQAQEPVDCLLRRHATMRTCTTTLDADQVRTLSQNQLDLAAIPGVSVLDTLGWVCSGHECPMVVGHTIVYLDPGHITEAYATELGPIFRVALRQVVAA